MTTDPMSELRGILRRAESFLRPRDVENIEEMISDHVWDFGFDILCTQLIEYKARIPYDLWSDIARYGKAIHREESQWRDISREH